MDALISFVVLGMLTWLAFLFVAKLAGVDKHYRKYSGKLAKAGMRPIGRAVHRHQKFFWGIGVGMALLLWLLSQQ